MPPLSKRWHMSLNISVVEFDQEFSFVFSAGQKDVELFRLSVTDNLKNKIPDLIERIKDYIVTETSEAIFQLSKKPSE